MRTRFSAHPDRPWGPPSLLYYGYRVFPGGKVRPGHADNHSPPSSAAVMEQYSYTSTHLLDHTGPGTGSLYLYLNSHILLAKPPNTAFRNFHTKPVKLPGRYNPLSPSLSQQPTTLCRALPQQLHIPNFNTPHFYMVLRMLILGQFSFLVALRPNTGHGF